MEDRRKATMTARANVVPFSPFNADEEALIDFYVSKKTTLGVEFVRILDELGAKDVPDLDLTALDAGAGLLIGKYAGGGPLPTWGFPDQNSRYQYTREEDEYTQKARRLLSITLLRINWAMSAPGFDWPEEYRVTWLPKPRRWILTLSKDSPEPFGCMDLALGHFTTERDRLVDKARPTVLRYWRLLKNKFGQPPWFEMFKPGLVGVEVAMSWRKLVWPRERDFYEL
jgi:hypothetical protein